MSGHSKWSTIKRKKGALDNKRGKIFSRLVKEIMVSVKLNGPDPDSNSRLRLALQNAKGQNMPKDNIVRAIKKGSENNTENFQELTYEGYASNGIGVFVECMTDNLNRTVANVRMYFSKYGGNLGTNGSLSFLFERKGVFTINSKIDDIDELTLELIDNGAEEIDFEENIITITTALDDFGKMQKKLDELKFEVENAELQRIPKERTKLGIEEAKKVMKLIDALEDDDDVQNVYHNLELTDDLINELT